MNTATVAEPTSNIVPIGPFLPSVATLLPQLQPGNSVTEIPPGRKRNVALSECKVRGETMWRVRYWENGKPRRVFKNSKAQAEAFAAEKRGELLTNKKKLVLIPPADADLLMTFYNEAQRRELPLSKLFMLFQGATLDKKESPAIQTVINEMILKKEDSHKADAYTKNLRQSWDKFAKGRELLPIDRFTTDDIENYLRGKSAGYKKTLLPKISMLFGYAKDRNYRPDNPCKSVAVIGKTTHRVEVFTIDEMKTALKWLWENPKALAWFINSSFAGLRPQDEACFTDWDKINFQKEYIVVEDGVCKTGRRRVVYPPKMVFAWLKVAKERGAVLPLTIPQLVYQQRKLRGVLGWPEFKQDVTRHSAASYWLVMTNDVKKVSRSLGNSITVLESKYDARVFEETGAEYYSLTPQKLELK